MLDVDARASFALENPAKILSNRIERDAALFFCSHLARVLVAEEDNLKSYYVDTIFNSIWQDGLNMNDDNVVQKVLKNLNINPKTFFLRSASASIKDSLRKRTSDAYDKGIF